MHVISKQEDAYCLTTKVKGFNRSYSGIVQVSFKDTISILLPSCHCTVYQVKNCWPIFFFYKGKCEKNNKILDMKNEGTGVIYTNDLVKCHSINVY